MLRRTGKAETNTTHYLFALGIYRALYILSWIWRFFTDSPPHHLEPVAILAGIMRTILYSDFFYLYYTKWADLICPLVLFGRFLRLYPRVVQGKKFDLPV